MGLFNYYHRPSIILTLPALKSPLTTFAAGFLVCQKRGQRGSASGLLDTFHNCKITLKTTQRYCRVSNLKVQKDYFKAMAIIQQRREGDAVMT